MNGIESIMVHQHNQCSFAHHLTRAANTNYTSRPDSILRLKHCRQIKVKTESKQFSAHGNDRDAYRAFLLHFMQTKRERDSFFEFALVGGGAFF